MDENNELVKCDLCEKSLFSEFLSKHMHRSSLDSHMLAHIVYKHLEFLDSGNVKCLDCNETFSSIDSAKKHYKDMHMADKNGNKFICKLCKVLMKSSRSIWQLSLTSFVKSCIIFSPEFLGKTDFFKK